MPKEFELLLGFQLSIPAKLADYEETRELLARLSVKELKKLATKNSIELEKRDWTDEVKPARTKEEIIDVLVDSEFRESDLTELLGISRLTKQELLNYMTVKQLRELERQNKAYLKKSPVAETRRLATKADFVSMLRFLPPSRIRRYGRNVALTQRKAERKGVMKRKSKRRRISKVEKTVRSIGLLDIKEHEKFVKVLNTTHAMRVLLAIDMLQKPSTLHEIKSQIHQAKAWLDSDELRYVIKKLEDLNIVRRMYETIEKRRIPKYEATEDGKKFVAASKRFLHELQRR